MNNLESFGIPSFKKGSGIHIKKKNRGKFTEYCKGKVTQKCIDKAKKSGNKTLVKRATFAENARKWKHLQGGLIKKFLNPSDKLKVIKPTNGGYDESSYAKRKRDLHRWTPAAGLYDPFLLIFNNDNTGEENEYYKTYLGFESAVPLMTSGSETEWDALIELEKKNNGELPSEFYGTTPRMDHHLQAAADTLNLGKMVRGEIPLIEGLSLDVAKRAYELAKRVMDNPGKWLLMQDYVIQTNPEFHETYENNPLGMLYLYGMKWDPKLGKLFVHDTYDFPKWAYKIGFMLKRPREMKIRGAIKFDPKKGSLLLRDKNYKWPLLKVLK